MAGTTITASDHNANWDDIEAEITNSLALDGQSTMTGQFKASSGTVAAPGITFGSDTDSGLYRTGANEIGLALGGSNVATLGAAAWTIVPAVTFTAAPVFSASGFISASHLASNAVTTAKITDANVTLAKLANIATSTIIGRSTSGSGVPEELTLSGLAISGGVLSVGAGGVVKSAYGEYTSNALLTTQIPVDDSIPQNTQGAEIITAAITPSSSSNKLRIRFQGFFSASTAASLTAAFFQDSTAAALNATVTTTSGANVQTAIVLEHEVTAGTTSATTIKVRVGPAAGGVDVRMNGTSAARLFGGIARATLVVEEIKV